MAIRETVYNGYDNSIDLILKEDGAAYTGLSAVTRMKCVDKDGDWTIDSAVDATAFDWATEEETGKVLLKFGLQSIAAGSYIGKLIVYDADHTNGIFWDYIGLVFV